MKISREEYKNIRYICKKFNISPESFHIKTLAATLDKRLLRRRFVLGFAVRHKKQGHFLVWNNLKRIDIRHKFLSKNVNTQQHHKSHRIISWRRAVRKVRRSKIAVTSDRQEDEASNDSVIETSRVRDKLKEQLQLLQLGKKKKLMLKSDKKCNGKNEKMTNGEQMHGECFDDDDDMDPLRVTPDVMSEKEDEKVVDEKKSILSEFKTPKKTDVVPNDEEETPKLSDTGYNSPSITPSKKGFLDSLLNKFKTSDTETKETKPDQVNEEEILPEPVLIPMSEEQVQRTTRMRSRKAVHHVRKELDEIEKSSKNGSERDLFNLGEKSVPGLLATPKAQNTKASAFVDQESADEIKVKLEKIEDETLKNIDQKEHEGLVCSKIKPPHLEKPKKLADLVRPRTVAEKRQLMQKKKGIKFLMMENESKIYNELAKINREDYDYTFNFPMLTALQKETVPYRRDAWRALSFLKTEKNRFFYKVIYVDGVKCNLLGSRGNFDGKKKFKAISSPFPKYLEYRSRIPCCKPVRIPKNIKINLDIPVIRETPEDTFVSKKLLDYDKTILNMKPGPLREKLRKQSSRLSTDECLGPLELYTMPTVELEVHPKLGRQIDPKVQPYLKYLLPYENITESWARFSVALLKENEKDIADEKFSFPIPYSNNQNKILVRRRKEIPVTFSNEDKALAEDIEKPLSFTKAIDPNDTLGQEIGQILSEMTNTVAIGLSESCFIQNDPDLDYSKQDKPLEVIPVKPEKKSSVSKRIVRELRKLNATFITADNQSEKCNEKFCKKGCVCESLSTSLIFKNHCKKQECMIECTCASNRYHVNDEEIKDCNFTSDEVQSLREKATARLARIEKDFTPTLVLSNNSTYLIPGSDREHARRSKRAPKRYSDFVDSSKMRDGEECGEIVPLSEPAKSKFTPKDPLEATLYQMKHCNVVLRPLQHVTQIEPWCMVHRLYKCFCNGQATEGRAFTFDDLEEGLEERFDYGIRKPRYEFERIDAKDRAAKRDRRFSSSASSSKDGSLSNGHSPPKSRRSSISQPLIDLDSLDLVKFETNVAQRCVPIDDKYKRRDPRETNLKKTAIQKYEQKHAYAESLLQKRLTECERHFHREARKMKHRPSTSHDQNATNVDETPPVTNEVSPLKRLKTRLSRPIRLNIENSVAEVQAISMLRPLVTKNVVLVATGKNKIYAKKDLFYAGKLDFTKVMEKAKHTIFIIEKTPEEQANNREFLKANRSIRRARLVDINKIINIILQPESESVKELANQFSSSQDSQTETENPISSVNISASELNQEAGSQRVQHINSMISKAMQYICTIQKKNTPKLVEPTQSKMYFFTWRCMLQGFQQNLLSVWEVKCRGNRCAVVVTQGSAKPAVDHLEELRNVKACTVETPRLHLFSKMLLLKIDGEKTKNLSLVLYGGSNFWRVTGFVNSEIDYQRNGVVARPTPETHPELSTKINYLFNLLHSRLPPEVGGPSTSQATEKSNGKCFKTNIKICTTDNMPSIRSLFLPIPEVPHQRWFMLQIENDFSDIYIPNWGDYLSYDKVSYALALAKKHSKTVRVTMNDKFPEIYATPRRSNCIFFGPYGMHDNIDYVLCQNVDGETIDRETYEKRFEIKKEKATLGSWLYPKRDSDASSQEGEPSPKVKKILPKPAPKEKSPETLPFIITQVQTAITDPNLIPAFELSDEETPPVEIPMKRKSIDSVPSVPEKRLKVDEPPKPLKVTLLRQEGEGYAIKPVPASQTSNKVGPLKRVSLPELTQKQPVPPQNQTPKDQTDHQLMGKRISLPLSAVKSMKPMMIPLNQVEGQNNVNISKSTPPTTSTQTSAAPSKNKPEINEVIPLKTVDGILQKVLIKTAAGVEIKSIMRKIASPSTSTASKVIVGKANGDGEKRCTYSPTLPSSISVTSIAPTITTKPTTSDTKKVTPSTKQNITINKQPIPVLSKVIPLQKKQNMSVANPVATKNPDDIVQGYYVSGIPAIGKIMAEKRGERLILKMRNSDGYYVRRQFMGGQSMQYLNRYLQGLLHAFIPENFVLPWKFETSKDIVDKYPEHDPNKVPRKMVITKYGGILLKQSWDHFTYLENLDKNLYLKILLIKLADDCFPDSKIPNWDVLKILQMAQTEITNLEKRTPELVKAKTVEQTKNTNLLIKLDALKLLYPNVKLPKVVSPVIKSPEKTDKETETTQNDAKAGNDDDDVKIVSIQKKGIEVICLDDDED